MKPIPFSYVSSRKLSTQNNVKAHKISYRTVSENLSVNNLLLFAESTDEDMDTHYLQSLALYNRLLSEQDISNMNKVRIESSLLSTLPRLTHLDAVYEMVSDCDGIEVKSRFFDSLKTLEHCDRVLRNDEKLSKRFDFNKTIQENVLRGTKHTVFELCSLIDTYNISSKAKFNIALENVSYAIFKSGYDIDLTEVTEHVVDYFLTREAVITDKEYDGYIDVLETNQFIDSSNSNLSYVFEARKEKGNSFKAKAAELLTQCETKECATHMSQLANIKNEKQASKYIDDSVEMIIADNITKNDSLLLLKSVYCLPLIGNVSKEFVDYKVEMSKSKFKIKKKLTGIENEKIIRDILDDGEMIDYVAFVSESVSFPDYILDDHYEDETDPVKLLEGSGSSDEIEYIIKSFKASNEKSTSKFKNMISRIMTKSPENIIDGTPNIFGTARIMLYLAVGASSPVGPILSAILMLVNKMVTMHLDLKQAEKLLRHLKSEKEKAEKKLDKLSGKEKENQEEYIDCIKKCIKKVEDFISKIDDENEEINKFDGGDDDFDFGDDDDLDFDLEAAMESAVEFETNPLSLLLNTTGAKEIIDSLETPVDNEILTNIAVLFDNCPLDIKNEFYAKLDSLGVDTVIKESGKVTDDENSFVVQHEALKVLDKLNKDRKNNKDIKNNKNGKEKSKPAKINLNTLKMAVINFKKKFRDLRGKEQELWKNIDIATVNLSKGIQQALTSDRREAIIKGSIIPSFSKCIKFAISVGAIGAFTGPVGAAISAVGMLGASKILNERERRLLYDEIDTELQVVEKQIQLAENEGNMNQYRFLLNYEKKLKREKARIKYGIHMSGRTIPELKGRRD